MAKTVTIHEVSTPPATRSQIKGSFWQLSDTELSAVVGLSPLGYICIQIVGQPHQNVEYRIKLDEIIHSIKAKTDEGNNSQGNS